jgi:uncharacterized membrane protein YbhN (UPF0104 family)
VDPPPRSDGRSRRTIRNWLVPTIGVIVSGGLLCFLLTRADTGRAVAVLADFHWGYLGLSAMLLGLVLMVVPWRWLGILKAQNWGDISYGLAFRANSFAYVLNLVLPAKGGDLAKLVYLRKRHGLASITGTVVVERLVDLFILGLISLAGAWWSGWSWGWLIGGSLLALVAAVMIVCALIPPADQGTTSRLKREATELLRIFRRTLRRPGALALSLAASLACWLLCGGIVVVLLAAMGRASVWPRAMAVFPLAVLVGLVPISVGGIGTRDTAFAFLMAGYVSYEQTLVIGLGYTFFAYYLAGLGSLPIVLIDNRAIFIKLKRRRALLTEEAKTGNLGDGTSNRIDKILSGQQPPIFEPGQNGSLEGQKKR